MAPYGQSVCIFIKSLRDISESLRSCVSVYVNRKRSQIDAIGAQMQTSLRALVQNFYKIPSNVT